MELGAGIPGTLSSFANCILQFQTGLGCNMH